MREEMHEQKNENVWLSKATLECREDARKTSVELAGVIEKCSAIVSTDGDPDKQVEKLTPLYAKRDILTAKLARLREALFTAIVADARAEHAAAVEEVALCTAKGAALRDLWRAQVQVDVKDGGAKKNMLGDSRYWPAELRDVAADKAALQARATDAARRMQSIDYSEHAAARARDAAIPCGGWLGKSVFWNRAAALVPELGTMETETKGTAVFIR
jgi:hypothetical protein